ncbi:MAG: DUF4349 domain-containing protein [Sphingobacteriales bacterium]|nr:MAG: DUF4349 domain-containing protein [Sphingobacteriales bacterium]
MLRYILIAVIPVILFSSCASNTEEYFSSADSTGFANDVTLLNSPSRKIVKQVEIKSKVKDVLNAVSAIEEMTRSLDGLVALSEMQTGRMEHKTLHYKVDSLKEVTVYNTTANLQVKVPSYLLDTMLVSLPALMDFVSYRNIKQDDRTLAYLRNSLKNELYVAKMETDEKHTPITHRKQGVINADSSKAEQVVDRRIENLQLLDDVNYTTINIQLSQDGQVHTAIVPDVTYASKEPFSTQVLYALGGGLDILKGIVVLLVRIWPLLFMSAIIWVLYNTRLRRKAKSIS